MKIARENNEFNPVIIRIESLEEAREIYTYLHNSKIGLCEPIRTLFAYLVAMDLGK